MKFFESEANTYRLCELSFAKKINKVIYSNWFVALLALMTVVGNFYEIELIMYAFVAMLTVYMALFGKDFRLLLPLFIYCYVMPGIQNNPGRYSGSIFYMENGAYWLIIYASFLIPAILFRLCADREIGFRNLKNAKPTLLIGIFVLGVAYLLSGIGSEGYAEVSTRNVVFALLQIVSLAVPYFFLCFTVKWKDVDRHYCAIVGLLFGLIICLELLHVYAANEVIVGESIRRGEIYTGWGNNNNMGVLIAMAIPFAFYFIYRGKHVVINSLLAAVLLIFCVLTTSRGAVLGGVAVYALCSLWTLLFSKKYLSKLSVLIFALAGAVVICKILDNPEFFQVVFRDGLQSNSRLEIYKAGMQIFGENRIFGTSFYMSKEMQELYDLNMSWSDVDEFLTVFPGRWHNTFVQLLTCCGILGLVTYAVHRIQTVGMFLRKRTAENVAIAASIIVLLALSMLDCHFFNIGPGLVYSGLLAFAQHKGDKKNLS